MAASEKLTQEHCKNLMLLRPALLRVQSSLDTRITRPSRSGVNDSQLVQAVRVFQKETAARRASKALSGTDGANDSGAGKSLSPISSCKHSRAIIDWELGK